MMPRSPSGRLVSGVIRQWNGAEGWGVIDADDTPGGCWFHFSVVNSPSGHAWDLVTGQRVDFMFEAVPDQDGYAFRATRLLLGGTGTTSEPSAAYASRLRVELHENDLAD